MLLCFFSRKNPSYLSDSVSAVRECLKRLFEVSTVLVVQRMHKKTTLMHGELSLRVSNTAAEVKV